jgi:hypothetical protein
MYVCGTRVCYDDMTVCLLCMVIVTMNYGMEMEMDSWVMVI